MKKIGFTDTPTLEDGLKRENYLGALSEIVKKCNTPMTISITGEWGIGKTSFVNMLQKEIRREEEYNKIPIEKSNIVFIDLNVWKISQFKIDDVLKYSLLKYLIENILQEVDTTKIPNVKKILSFLKSFNIAATFGIKNFAEIEISKDGKNESDSTSINNIDIVSEMECFINGLNKAISFSNKRFIIFIDDLDRIEPRIAVEILEFLKLYFSFENCVYLLAVDEMVISQGLKSKFKNLPEKFYNSRNYFEKLVQLPFYLPNALTEDELLDGYLDKLIKNNNTFSINDNNYVKNSIKSTVGSNPRKIKRILNAAWFYKLVLNNKIIESINNIDDIVFIVCFQEKYLKEFDKFKEIIYENRLTSKSTTLNGLLQEENEVDDREKFEQFVRGFMDSISSTTTNNNLRFNHIKSIISNAELLTMKGTSETVEHDIKQEIIKIYEENDKKTMKVATLQREVTRKIQGKKVANKFSSLISKKIYIVDERTGIGYTLEGKNGKRTLATNEEKHNNSNSNE